jgi:predicted DNA binding CopG/RHH family protein
MAVRLDYYRGEYDVKTISLKEVKEKKEETKALHIRISKELYEKFKKAAGAEGLSITKATVGLIKMCVKGK